MLTMASTLVELAIAARLAAGATARRCLGKLEPEPDRVAFRHEFDALLKSAPPDAIRAAKWIEMPASEPPWCESGLSLEPGEHVTWFACGRVYVAKALDIFAPPALQVWARIGTRGTVFAGTRDHHSFANDRDAPGTEAPASEPLYFGNYFPNDWSSREGATVHGPEIHRSAKGGTTILAIVWRGTSTAGLRALADTASVTATATAGAAQRAVADEIERLAQGRTAPEGWSYLWHLGEAEIFRAGVAPGGGLSVRCHTHRDVGILQRNVDFELTPDTRIAWRWKVDELPARLREDTTPTHDYLSLAIEFDNGLDLSYYWSASLPRERFYACPLENWKHKETHLVVRSGRAGLGEWQSEDRAIHTDYHRAIGTHRAIGKGAVGSAQATRITRVWFIAVSLFQRNTGRCEYTDIRLSNAEHTLVVL